MQRNYETIVKEFVEVQAPRYIENAKRFYSPQQYADFVRKIQSQVEAETYIGFAAMAAESLEKEIPLAFGILEQVEKGDKVRANLSYLSLPFTDRVKIYELLEESYYALELIDSLKQTIASSLEGVYPEGSPTQAAILKKESSNLERKARMNKRSGTELERESTLCVTSTIAN